MSTTSSTSSAVSSDLSSTLTQTGAAFSALGIGSGLDLQSIVSALVTEYSTPKTALQTALAKHTATVGIYQSMNTMFNTLETSAQKLNAPYDWTIKAASSSDSSVTATATSAASNGSLSFQVNKLATAEITASYGTVSSADSVVGTGSLLLGTVGSLGIGNVTGTGLSTGNHAIAVTQASAGASVKGTVLGNATTLTGSETINTTIDGVAKSFTLTAGTYNQAQLATMINNVSGGALNVSVNSDKTLNFATAHEGSAASLTIDGGTGLSALGLSTTSTTTNGTDGIITVDGVSNTVSSIMPDGTNSTTLNSTAGTITASFGGGLRLGSGNLANVDLGDGKLSTIVANINNSSSGVQATAVQVGDGQFKLQFQSSTTGAAGKISTDFGAFESTLGHSEVVAAAQNAQIQIGTGNNAYTVDSSSNSISNAVPGVTLKLTSADPAKTVTVSIGGDVTTLAANVKSMIDNVNSILSYISTNSTYDTSTKTAGPLLGNYQALSLQGQLQSAMTSMFAGSSLGSISNVGITSNEDGTWTFDQTKFDSAYAANPEAVADIFVDGGTKGNLSGNPGLAEKLYTLGHNSTDSINGSITTAINGEKATMADLNTQIDNWTDRIAKYQTQLMQQYSAADTTVAGLKSQQTYLTSSIAGLAANSA